MARPRKPTAILELNGSFRKNPNRKRKDEPKPSGPLGSPPERLSAEEKSAWFELESITPAKVLTNADRWLVEVACRLAAKMWKDGLGGRYGISIGELAQLNQCLSRMGLTPADRSKVGIPQDSDESNPFTEIAEESRGRNQKVN